MAEEALALFDEAGDELVNDYHVLVRIGGLVLPYDRDRTELSLYNSMRMFARNRGLFASRKRPPRTPYSRLSAGAILFLKTHPLPRLEAASPSETPPKPSASAAAACGAAPPVEASQEGEPLTLRTPEPQCGHSPEAMAAPSTPAPSSARTPAPPTPPPLAALSASLLTLRSHAFAHPTAQRRRLPAHRSLSPRYGRPGGLASPQ